MDEQSNIEQTDEKKYSLQCSDRISSDLVDDVIGNGNIRGKITSRRCTNIWNLHIQGTGNGCLFTSVRLHYNKIQQRRGCDTEWR